MATPSCHKCKTEDGRFQYTSFRRLCQDCMRSQLRAGPEVACDYPPLPPDFDEPNPESPAPFLMQVRCFKCTEWVDRAQQFLLFGNDSICHMYCLYCARQGHIPDEVDSEGKLKGKTPAEWSAQERYFARNRAYTRHRDAGMPIGTPVNYPCEL